MRVRAPHDGPAWRPGFCPPAPPQGDALWLTPLAPHLAELDLAAFTSCRARLAAELDWNGWPPEGFDLDDNRRDLAEHYREYERREAYAYSLLRARRCIGCVYVEPWTTGAQLAFWVIDEALPETAALLGAVFDWLAAWPFEAVVVPLRPWNERDQATLTALGLAPCEGPEGHRSFVRRS